MGVHGCTCGRVTGGGLDEDEQASVCVHVLSACAHVSLEVPGESLGRQTAGLSERIPPCAPLPGREWAGVPASRERRPECPPPTSRQWLDQGGWARVLAPSCPPSPPQRTRLPPPTKVMSK